MGTLPWTEYLVFGATLGGSLLVGLAAAWVDADRHTVAGYLFGGKRIGLVPITVSLVCSHISGVTLIGVPTEVYNYGTQYLISALGYVFVALVTIYVFLPVFYRLQLVSLYEYLELRYDRAVRRLVSIFFAIYMVFHTPLVAYGPAIILNQVSGADVFTAAFWLTAICIIYTTTGGLKAVVWTDTLQGAVMLLSVVVIACLGLAQLGGIQAVFSAANQGERLQLFQMDPDPRVRASFWSCLFGVSTVVTYLSCVHPVFVQRYVALPSLKQANRAAVWYSVGCLVFFTFSGFLGLIMYAKFQGCDPKAAGMIERSDQILPHFLMVAANGVPGLIGLFLAGNVSAALSTMSANLNTVSGTIFVDLIEPMFGKVSEARSSWAMRGIVVLLGALSLVILVFMDKLADILELANMVLGLSSGSIFGVFILGMFFPISNSWGCIGGAVSGMAMVTWIMVGSRIAVKSGQIHFPTKPMSLESCPGNTTSTLIDRAMEGGGGAFPLYEISVFYYTLLGFLVTLVLGLLLSKASGGRGDRPLDPRLLAPCLRPPGCTGDAADTTARTGNGIAIYTAVPLQEMLRREPAI